MMSHQKSLSTNNQENDYQIRLGKFNNIEWSFFDAIVLSILTLLFIFINFFINRISPSSMFYPVYYMRGQIALLIIFILFKLKKTIKINQYSLGLSFNLSKEAKTFLIVFLIFVSIVIVLFCVLTFKNISFDELYQNSVHFFLKDAIYHYDVPLILFYLIPHLIIVVIFSPLIEEVIFTAIIYPALRNKLGIFFALIITGLIFAFGHDVGNIFHFNKIAIIKFMIVFFSEILSFFLYQYTRSLYPSVLYHFVRNLFVALPLFNELIRMIVCRLG